MKKTLIFLLGIFTATTLLSQESVVFPSAWVRADSSALNGAVWQDVSGHGRFAVSATGTMPSSYAFMNFNHCFEINNGEYFRIEVDSLTNTQANVIIVYETADSVVENGLWSLRLDSVKRVGLTTQRILNNNGQIVFDTVNRLRKVVNYLSQSWETQNVDMLPHTLSFGIADNLPLNGKIAEFIFFDHLIQDTTVTQWISYIAVKYGVTLYQTNYLNSRKRCIWNYDSYPDFSYSIAGIGRDTLLGLHQKQTFFADNAIVFGIDSLFIDNEHNTAQIAEGNFIIMGMDSNSVINPISLYLSDGEEVISSAHSRVQVTGSEASQYSTFMHIDGSLWSQDSGLTALLIDRSGTGEYSFNDIEIYFPDSIDSNNILYFNNLYWDIDGNGTDAFCLVPVDTRDRAYQPEGGVYQRNCRAYQPEGVVYQPDCQPKYNLYPNPNKGQFTLEINYNEINDVSIIILTSEGKILKRMHGNNGAHYIFSDFLPTSGHYLIEINGKREKKTLKMIVQ